MYIGFIKKVAPNPKCMKEYTISQEHAQALLDIKVDDHVGMVCGALLKCIST